MSVDEPEAAVPRDAAAGQESAAEDPRTRDFDSALHAIGSAAAISPPQTGTVLGPYTLERLLGEGGMGEVWLAHRTDGRYQGQVAVKMLHPHLAGPEMRARFMLEGQFAAKLMHPNIARLYDAGSGSGGMAYLVFEYVEGQRIDRWCDAQRLDIAARVRLFLKVCEAVAHAHAHLIVHRDIKPTNIMVTSDGQVKLLDFGIAKLIETGAPKDHQTDLTRLGGRLLTPEYAAPEQVLGEAITTVTDVYSLGILLYLLLTGSRPYGTAQSTPAQLEREVVESDPRPMARTAGSTTAATADPTLTGSHSTKRAQRLGTTPARLRKELSGDLDTIVRKALKKSPADRYPSVLALQEDLQRYLDHEPVKARPDSFGYRATKFVRRNRTGTAAAALVLLSAAAGIAGVIWQAQIARQQARIASQQALIASQQAQRAERVKDFVVSVFQEEDPLKRTGTGAATPQQMIETAIARADEELRDSPDLHSELLDDLGEIQFNIGDVAASEKTLRRALQERETFFGADSLPVVDSLRRLTLPVVRQNGHIEEGIQIARRALSILQKHGEGDSIDAARVKVQLGAALSSQRAAPPESLALLADANRIFSARLGPDDPETIEALLELADVEHQGRMDKESEALLRQVIASYEKLYGPNTPRLAKPLKLLAIDLERNGQPQEAEGFLERSIALTRAALGPRHQLLASGLTNLGELEADYLGHFDKAETALTAAVAAVPIGDDLSLADTEKELGRLHLLTGHAEQAEPELHEAFTLLRQHDGEKVAFTWYVAGQWGRALAAEGRLAEAETIQREAVAKLAAVMGPDAYQNCMVLEVLADTQELKGAHGKGAPWNEILGERRRALALTEKKYPKTNNLWAQRAADLARALMAEGSEADRAEAQPLLDQAVTDFKTSASPTDPVGETLLLRGQLEIATGKRQAAMTDLDAAVQQLKRQLVKKPNALATAQALLNKTGHG